jgi:chromosome segregation ATPase
MRTRSPFVTGLIHPLNLLMLGLSVFAGLVSAWWLFPIGLLFWLIMVITVSRDPSLRISHEMQKREPLAQRFQKYFDRIERSQVGVFNSMSSAPARTRRALQPVQAEIDTLAMQVYALCHRMTVLENYRVVSQSQADLEDDLRQLDERIEAATDPVTKREYEESRNSLRGRIDKLKLVSTQLDRVEAQLMSLSSELDGVVTEVVRLQAMGSEAAAGFVPDLVNRLRQESTQLKEFEREAVQV